MTRLMEIIPSSIPGRNPATKLLPEKSSRESLVVDPSLSDTPSMALEKSAVDVGSSDSVVESAAVVPMADAELLDGSAEVVEVEDSVEAGLFAVWTAHRPL